MLAKIFPFRLLMVVAVIGLFGFVGGNVTSDWEREKDSNRLSNMRNKGSIEKKVPGDSKLQQSKEAISIDKIKSTNLKLLFKQPSNSLARSEKRQRIRVSPKGNKTKKGSADVSEGKDKETSRSFHASPYEVSSSYTGRKLLAEKIPENPPKAAANPKQTGQNSAKNTIGPGEYMAKWPALRGQMLELKKKISAARKQLDGPGNSLLERIDQGDELRQQASHVSNLQRLNHFGKLPDTKSVTALKNTYKDLDAAVTRLSKKTSKIEKSLTGKSVESGIQKLERELRKRMQFVTPSVDSAIKSGWSALTDSLADTTNFQYSVLKDRPKSPVFSIYRFGDGVGEKTYLDEDIKNMQKSIDSLSIHSVESTDPDLQRVDEILKDLLGQQHLTKMIDTENSIEGIDKVMKASAATNTFDENDLYFGVDHHQNDDVNDETSTLHDGVFYLFDPRNRPENIIRSGKDLGGETNIDLDAGAVTDKTSGGGVHEYGDQGPPDLTDIGDGHDDSLLIASDIDREKQEEVLHHNTEGNADHGMLTVDGHSVNDITRQLYRKARSAPGEPQHAGSRRKDVSKGSVVSDDENGGLERNIHTMLPMPKTDRDKPPKHRKYKSNEDRESYNMVDMEALDRKKMKMEKPLGGYKVEDEVDETGDEGSDVTFNSKHLPYEYFDKVPLKASLAESVDKDDDQEFEDESMEVASVNNDDFNLQDPILDRDRHLIKAYKSTLNLRPFLQENLRETDPNFNRINDGLADDIRLGPNEIVEETDNPVYGLDINYPPTGPNAGREVGSLAYWQKEIDRLSETERRNNILAGKLQHGFMGDNWSSTSHRDGDLLFLEAADEARHKSLPRLGDLFSDQVRNIMQETKETIKSGRKRLPPWRKSLDFEADVSEGTELERRKEDELASLINPDLGVMIKRMENIEASHKPGDMPDVNKLVLGLLDDAPVNPEEFDYLRDLADVSLFTKPVKANPATLKQPSVKDKITKSALQSLDRASDTLKQIGEDMKLRQRDQLKKELADVRKVSHDVKIGEERKKMEKMLEHIQAIPKLQAMNDELRKKRIDQYESLTARLAQAYKQRERKQKQNYQEYMRLAKKMKENKKKIDKTAAQS